jgi:hypothetical protein
LKLADEISSVSAYVTAPITEAFIRMRHGKTLAIGKGVCRRYRGRDLRSRSNCFTSADRDVYADSTTDRRRHGIRSDRRASISQATVMVD